MICITERDKDLFRYLSSGPATVDQICQFILRVSKTPAPEHNDSDSGKETENKKKPQRKQKTDRTKKVVYERLSKLIRSGYIRVGYYTRKDGLGRFALYALSNFSTEYLVDQCNYRLVNIRRQLPTPNAVSHEIAVTGIVRAVKNEAYRSRCGISVIDEIALKKANSQVGNGKAYPDLLVYLRWSDQLRHKYAIEIDSSTVPHRDMIYKLTNITAHTLHLCKTMDRVNELRTIYHKMAKENPYEDQTTAKLFKELPERTVFGILSDFQNKAVLGNQFVSMKGDLVEIVPEGYRYVT